MTRSKTRSPRSYRSHPLAHWILSLIYRFSRSSYRHIRGMLGPWLEALFGVAPARSNYAEKQYYAAKQSASKSTKKSPAHKTTSTTASGGRTLTLAEKHAAEYRRRVATAAQPERRQSTPEERRQTSVAEKSQTRLFNEKRPTNKTAVVANIKQENKGNQKFSPLPAPTGNYPYHLLLDQILPDDHIKAIQQSGRILMHMAGDTGGVKSPEPQQIVAMAMEDQCQFSDLSAIPAYFYHLGDVVYFFGEAREYYPQFYDPYVHYPAPIFAIPGNHDGDVADDNAVSLESFVRNFCSPTTTITREAGEVGRHAMTQPNVYWTLEAPFVTTIGLYSNVPEGGVLDGDQIDWFINELRTAPTDKALLLACHHPAYSADSHHSGSHYIAETLDKAFETAGRIPDMILSGHVHNYQRFTRHIPSRDIPYIVAGAGGYWHLHYMAKANGTWLPVPYQIPDVDGLTLEQYCDNRHGFLRMMVTPQFISGEYWTVPHPHEQWRAPAQRIDGFMLDWHSHRLVKNDPVKWQAERAAEAARKEKG